ncbi:thiamine phosphate synthase [Peptoniphilus stercorisuis]|uniref:Thiamine-phosphate synthase n=1 Tax=Peptoniphilus stercorisuis TaxID=1436965 RepID=A0ABS4KAF4_9FIRM|nr:thiamine phosphate synthase [Peptoniphilus stercorisuis]MBP2024763.1 thiamine-phosphate pyrophosphorylase [Peptoniphilus stercorisuis]
MKVNREDMRCYVVTTRDFLDGRALKDDCEEILKNGATFLQLREKNIDFDEYVNLGFELKEVAKKYNIPFVIDDNIEVAIKVDADGVHIGQSDIDAKTARKLIGEDKILGVSAQNVYQAIEAEKMGADYLGIGPVFPTKTKPNEKLIDLDEVRRISESVNIPILVIGGIDDESIYKVKNSNTDGVAVISYIFNSDTKGKNTRKLREISDELFRK